MMEPEQTFLIEKAHHGLRIDKILGEFLPQLSRSALQKKLEEGEILINGAQVEKRYKGKEGDVIAVLSCKVKELNIEAQSIPLDIIYEDKDLLVVNKGQGMVVHPAPGSLDGTLVNALLAHCKESLSGINGVARPGIVHRIDKDTSGLLIVAKNDVAHVSLAQQIKEHSFTRKYEAIVYGRLKEEQGEINGPIGRSQKDRKKMCITYEHSKEAKTFYKVLSQVNGFCHIECVLHTGRTHQIRVHMASLGHPVAGDLIYGPAKNKTGEKGQLLHAKTIGFVHPTTGEYMEFSTPTPKRFTDFLKKHEN